MEEKKKEVKQKEIIGIVYARIVGLNNRDQFYINKKYKNQKKTEAEWKKQLQKDGLVIKK